MKLHTLLLTLVCLTSAVVVINAAPSRISQGRIQQWDNVFSQAKKLLDQNNPDANGAQIENLIDQLTNLAGTEKSRVLYTNAVSTALNIQRLLALGDPVSIQAAKKMLKGRSAYTVSQVTSLDFNALIATAERKPPVKSPAAIIASAKDDVDTVTIHLANAKKRKTKTVKNIRKKASDLRNAAPTLPPAESKIALDLASKNDDLANKEDALISTINSDIKSTSSATVEIANLLGTASSTTSSADAKRAAADRAITAADTAILTEESLAADRAQVDALEAEVLAMEAEAAATNPAIASIVTAPEVTPIPAVEVSQDQLNAGIRTILSNLYNYTQDKSSASNPNPLRVLAIDIDKLNKGTVQPLANVMKAFFTGYKLGLGYESSARIISMSLATGYNQLVQDIKKTLSAEAEASGMEEGRSFANFTISDDSLTKLSQNLLADETINQTVMQYMKSGYVEPTGVVTPTPLTAPEATPTPAPEVKPLPKHLVPFYKPVVETALRNIFKGISIANRKSLAGLMLYNNNKKDKTRYEASDIDSVAKAFFLSYAQNVSSGVDAAKNAGIKAAEAIIKNSAHPASESPTSQQYNTYKLSNDALTALVTSLLQPDYPNKTEVISGMDSYSRYLLETQPAIMEWTPIPGTEPEVTPTPTPTPPALPTTPPPALPKEELLPVVTEFTEAQKIFALQQMTADLYHDLLSGNKIDILNKYAYILSKFNAGHPEAARALFNYVLVPYFQEFNTSENDESASTKATDSIATASPSEVLVYVRETKGMDWEDALTQLKLHNIDALTTLVQTFFSTASKAAISGANKYIAHLMELGIPRTAPVPAPSLAPSPAIEVSQAQQNMRIKTVLSELYDYTQTRTTPSKSIQLKVLAKGIDRLSKGSVDPLDTILKEYFKAYTASLGQNLTVKQIINKSLKAAYDQLSQKDVVSKVLSTEEETTGMEERNFENFTIPDQCLTKLSQNLLADATINQTVMQYMKSGYFGSTGVVTPTPTPTPPLPTTTPPALPTTLPPELPEEPAEGEWYFAPTPEETALAATRAQAVQAAINSMYNYTLAQQDYGKFYARKVLKMVIMANTENNIQPLAQLLTEDPLGFFSSETTSLNLRLENAFKKIKESKVEPITEEEISGKYQEALQTVGRLSPDAINKLIAQISASNNHKKSFDAYTASMTAAEQKAREALLAQLTPKPQAALAKEEQQKADIKTFIDSIVNDLAYQLLIIEATNGTSQAKTLDNLKRILTSNSAADGAFRSPLFAAYISSFYDNILNGIAIALKAAREAGYKIINSRSRGLLETLTSSWSKDWPSKFQLTVNQANNMFEDAQAYMSPSRYKNEEDAKLAMNQTMEMFSTSKDPAIEMLRDKNTQVELVGRLMSIIMAKENKPYVDDKGARAFFNSMYLTQIVKAIGILNPVDPKAKSPTDARPPSSKVLGAIKDAIDKFQFSLDSMKRITEYLMAQIKGAKLDKCIQYTVAAMNKLKGTTANNLQIARQAIIMYSQTIQDAERARLLGGGEGIAWVGATENISAVGLSDLLGIPISGVEVGGTESFAMPVPGPLETPMLEAGIEAGLAAQGAIEGAAEGLGTSFMPGFEVSPTGIEVVDIIGGAEVGGGWWE